MKKVFCLALLLFAFLFCSPVAKAGGFQFQSFGGAAFVPQPAFIGVQPSFAFAAPVGCGFGVAPVAQFQSFGAFPAFGGFNSFGVSPFVGGAFQAQGFRGGFGGARFGFRGARGFRGGRIGGGFGGFGVRGGFQQQAIGAGGAFQSNERFGLFGRLRSRQIQASGF